MKSSRLNLNLSQINPVHILMARLKCCPILLFHLRLAILVVWSGFWTKVFVHIHFSHASYTSCLSHSPPFDHANNVRWVVKFTKPPITQISTSTCYFLYFRSKYSSQHNLPLRPELEFGKGSIGTSAGTMGLRVPWVSSVRPGKRHFSASFRPWSRLSQSFPNHQSSQHPSSFVSTVKSLQNNAKHPLHHKTSVG
jgi:hypothetical protein